MQTILGSTGVIGTGVAKHLTKYTDRIRLVSRNPEKVNPDDEIFPADITDKAQTMKAVEGSDVVYLTAGLKYDIRVWREQWPRIMRNVIEACKKADARLVFFDNVYSYGKVDGWMTEETPYNPVSRKGKVRAEIATMLMDEVNAGGLSAMIARAADFYGPNTPLSIVNVTVFENLRKGKSAQWFGTDRARHSLTFSPDAAKATALLGNTEGAYGQVWHLPTDPDALTGRELIEMAAREFDVNPKYMVVKKWILGAMGLFNREIHEIVEMYYQNDSDYLFDSSKFSKAFDLKATPYLEGIRETAGSMK